MATVFVNFLSFLFLWIVIFAHLMWWAERHDNAGQFPYSYIDGIDDSVWWAAVTGALTWRVRPLNFAPAAERANVATCSLRAFDLSLEQ